MALKALMVVSRSSGQLVEHHCFRRLKGKSGSTRSYHHSSMQKKAHLEDMVFDHIHQEPMELASVLYALMTITNGTLGTTMDILELGDHTTVFRHNQKEDVFCCAIFQGKLMDKGLGDAVLDRYCALRRAGTPIDFNSIMFLSIFDGKSVEWVYAFKELKVTHKAEKFLFSCLQFLQIHSRVGPHKDFRSIFVPEDRDQESDHLFTHVLDTLTETNEAQNGRAFYVTDLKCRSFLFGESHLILPCKTVDEGIDWVISHVDFLHFLTETYL